MLYLYVNQYVVQNSRLQGFFYPLQIANAAYFQIKIQLPGFSAYSVGSESQLIREVEFHCIFLVYTRVSLYCELKKRQILKNRVLIAAPTIIFTPLTKNSSFFLQGLLNGTEMCQDQSYLAWCKISRCEQVSESMKTTHSMKNLKTEALRLKQTEIYVQIAVFPPV